MILQRNRRERGGVSERGDRNERDGVREGPTTHCRHHKVYIRDTATEGFYLLR